MLIIIIFILIGTLAFSVSIGSYNLYLADDMRGKTNLKIYILISSREQCL